MTAFELCGQYNDQQFKLKGGRVVWESITYLSHLDKCYISRIVETGGRSWFMGLRQLNRYINPDTEVIIMEK